MTNDAWDALVRRLDQKAKQDPAGYKRSVALWALGGYAVLAGALVLAVGVLVGVGAAIAAGATALLLKLAIPAVALAVVVARSLFVKLPPPEGIELTREDAAALFDEIDRLRDKLQTPRIHQVLLDGDFNAAIVQIPRLGPFGWSRNYLIVGLPYMQAMGPEEFASVLAHELGHIGGGHGRFSSWIYRLRSSWARVTEELDRGGHAGAGLLRRFFDWFVPRFSAHSFALARAHEYEADRAAADAVGARHKAMALVRGHVAAAAEGGYWQQVYRRALEDPSPPRTAYTGLRDALPAPPSEDGVAALRRALSRPTDTTDTHPSLRDRLTALGCPPEQFDGKAVGPPAETAAAHFFEPSTLARLTQRLDHDWHEAVRDGWQQRNTRAREERQELEQLDRQAAAGELSVEQARARARLTQELHGDEAAVSRWRELLLLEPLDAEANVAVGRYLLDQEQDAGLDFLRRAAAQDPRAAIIAADLAEAYENARGRRDEAARYRRELNLNLDLLSEAAAERDRLSAADAFDPHLLSADDLAALREQLMQIDEVGSAYLARKRVAGLADESPLYVLGLVRKRKLLKLESVDADHQLVDSVLAAVELPGDVFVVVMGGDFGWLRKRLKDVPNALVFER